MEEITEASGIDLVKINPNDSDSVIEANFTEGLKPEPGQPEPLKIIVAGSRGYNHYHSFNVMMQLIVKDLGDFEIISGAAKKGPDNMVLRWASENGVLTRKLPADWEDINVPNAIIKKNVRGVSYNARAGLERNNRMAEIATHLILFWDGKSPGSKHMLNAAKARNLKIFIVMVNED